VVIALRIAVCAAVSVLVFAHVGGAQPTLDEVPSEISASSFDTATWGRRSNAFSGVSSFEDPLPEAVAAAGFVDRTARLLDLDRDQRSLLIALVDDAQAEYTTAWLDLSAQREEHLFTYALRYAVTARQHPQIRESLDNLRLMHGLAAQARYDAIERAGTHLRAVLRPEQAHLEPLIDADRERLFTLGPGATFEWEGFDPVRIADSLTLGPQDGQVMHAEVVRYLRALMPLLERRNGSAAAAEEIGIRIRELRSQHVAGPDPDSDALEKAAQPLRRAMVDPSVETYNASIEILRLNIETIERIRRVLSEDGVDQWDRAVSAFGSEQRFTFASRPRGRYERLWPGPRTLRIGAALLDDAAELSSADEARLAQIREVLNEAEGDMDAPLTRLRSMERVVKNATPAGSRRVRVQTLAGRVTVSREGATSQTGVYLRDQAPDVLEIITSLTEIDRRPPDRLRGLLTPTERALYADR